MGTSAEHRQGLRSTCDASIRASVGGVADRTASRRPHPSLLCRARSPAAPRFTSTGVAKRGEAIPLVLFVVTSVDTTLSGRSDHARRSEEGLQRRLANEPCRTLRDFWP